MLILAVETSCDETSVAVVEKNSKTSGFLIRSNIVSSQVKIHEKWGGVVPNLAAREHLKNIIPVLDESLAKAGVPLSKIDLLAVTKGPGLIPALLIGTNAAKTLSYFYHKPLLGINHIEGHIYANFIGALESPMPNSPSNLVKFPILCLVVSGGHTQLVLMKDHLDYEILGQTIDDAAGEAFDKVAKILELGYPGGPIVSQRADQAKHDIAALPDSKLKTDLQSIVFPRPLLGKRNYDFSFSGLKTAVLYFYKRLQAQRPAPTHSELELWKTGICHAFEEAATSVLINKTVKALQQYPIQTVMLAGGVAANKKLREGLRDQVKKIDPQVTYNVPDFEYCGDNAAMIAVAAYYRYQKIIKNSQDQNRSLKKQWQSLEADANLKLQ